MTCRGDRWILASASPRRREILSLLNLPLEVIPPATDEERLEGESAEAYLERVTRLKGIQVAARMELRDWVISADTIVLCDERVLGKPADESQARSFLHLLQGREHEVWTGVAVWHQGRQVYRHGQTTVRFAPLSEGQINHYLQREAIMDKAGAYAVQGLAAAFIPEIRGGYHNVVGFPLALFVAMVREIWGEDLLTYDGTACW